jgi:hypothetical protein
LQLYKKRACKDNISLNKFLFKIEPFGHVSRNKN